MNEPIIKETPKWAYVALGVIGALIICALLFWVTSKVYPPEIPDSSKEVEVLVKDSLETHKWQVMYDSVRKEHSNYKTTQKRSQSFINQTIKQNEATKQRAVSVDDSTAYAMRDSLRARYIEVTRKRNGGHR